MSGRAPHRSLAERLFATALSAFPEHFRQAFGDSMQESFEIGLSERAGAGRWLFVARATLSTAVAGLTERMRPTYRPAGRAEPRTRTMTMRLGDLRRDLGYALRSAARRPGFTAVTVITIALGVGANTAIFSLVDGVLLKPLDYPNSDRLVAVQSNWNGSYGAMSWADMSDLQARARSVETIVGMSTSRMTLTGSGPAETILVARLTTGLLAPLGLAPVLGRDIRADEFGAEAPRRVVLSYGFWQERFGGNPGVLGQNLELSRNNYEIIGVAPPEADYPADARLWIPYALDPASCGRGCHNMRGLGLLTSADALLPAQTEAEGIAVALERESPETNTDKRFRLEALQESIVGDVRAGLSALLWAVGLVLLIACVNVANLLLVRASTRTAEFSVRKALGASRGRLTSQSLVESLVLAVFGAVLGLAVAAVALELLPSLAGNAIPRLETVGIDGRVLGYSVVLTLVVTLLFGLAPALLVGRQSLQSGLATGRTDRSGRARGRNWLLASEVALSAVLLIGAGLMIRSLYELNRVEVGYDTEEVVRFRVSLPRAEYPEAADADRFFTELEESLAREPGVLAVGSVWSGILGGSNISSTLTVEGYPDPAPEDEVEPDYIPFGPGLLDVLGLQPVRGRAPTADEFHVGSEAVAMINETLARRLFPDDDPLGQLVNTHASIGYAPTMQYRVVGILPDVRRRGLRTEPRAAIWLPRGHFGSSAMTVTVKFASIPDDMLTILRAAVAELDPYVPIYSVDTLAEARKRQTADTRFFMILSVAFAVLASLLAAVGLYGVVAYAVSRRTREIGLRIALGADRERVTGLVLLQGLRPAAFGLVAGLIGAWMIGRLLEGVVYGVQPRDPVTYGATAVLLLAIAALATLLPARRAARVDPMVALGSD